MEFQMGMKERKRRERLNSWINAENLKKKKKTELSLCLSEYQSYIAMDQTTPLLQSQGVSFFT